MNGRGAPRKDYYAILEVPKDASNELIRKQYLKLALKWHPDKHPEDKQGAEQKFRDIREAYSVLKDPQQRRQYDSPSSYPMQGQQFHPFTRMHPQGKVHVFMNMENDDPFDLIEKHFRGHVQDMFADFGNFSNIINDFDREFQTGVGTTQSGAQVWGMSSRTTVNRNENGEQVVTKEVRKSDGSTEKTVIVNGRVVERQVTAPNQDRGQSQSQLPPPDENRDLYYDEQY
ncbi:hypothetical protein B4U80_09465 [Leptotrombidium deliense]|uniref:J domain-containing protein n=1 Tax=Leptotrombidium deliense TaxID=299467 RepID=A0A443S0L9_9ACAR|nr:hypothetical protein B4U80_09465 [Leptotrombidium deliense]